RLDRFGTIRPDRTASVERLQRVLPDLIPTWGIAAGRHILVTGADGRILARVPVDAALGDADRILDVISAAQLLTLPGQQAGAAASTPRSIAGAAACGTGTCRAAESSGHSRCSPCSGSTAAATF